MLIMLLLYATCLLKVFDFCAADSIKTAEKIMISKECMLQLTFEDLTELTFTLAFSIRSRSTPNTDRTKLTNEKHEIVDTKSWLAFSRFQKDTSNLTMITEKAQTSNVLRKQSGTLSSNYDSMRIMGNLLHSISSIAGTNHPDPAFQIPDNNSKIYYIVGFNPQGPDSRFNLSSIIVPRN